MSAEEPLPLSGGDAELLALVATGLTHKEIAARLGRSHGTVRNRLSQLYARLGVSSRTEAAVLFTVRGSRAPFGRPGESR